MYLIVGRPNCPWCDKAKEDLDAKGIQYVYVDMNKSMENMSMWKDILVNEMGVKTVPQIFKLTGGYDNLKESLDG